MVRQVGCNLPKFSSTKEADTMVKKHSKEERKALIEAEVDARAKEPKDANKESGFDILRDQEAALNKEWNPR